MRRVVAPLIAASLLCAPFVAGAQSSRDLQVPTAALSILELPRDQGLPLAMSRAIRVLHSLPHDDAPLPQMVNLDRLLTDLDRLDTTLSNAGPTGVSLSMAKTNTERGVLKQALSAVGLKLREQRQTYSVEVDSSKDAAAVRARLQPVGVDAAAVAKRLNAGESVAIVPGVTALPLPLTPDIWSSVVFERTVPEKTLFATIIRDRRASLLYYGLQSMTPGTLEYLVRNPDLLRHFYRDGAGPVAAFGRSFQIGADGHVFLPDGPEGIELWQGLVDEQVTRPDRFARVLFSRDSGRLAYFFDSVTRLDEPHRRFALGLSIKDRGVRADRFRALYQTFVAVEERLTFTELPFVRPSYDAATLLGIVAVTAEGAPAAPALKKLWSRVIDSEAIPGVNDRDVEQPDEDGTIDAAWLAERLVSSKMRQQFIHRLAFGQRLFGEVPPSELQDVLVALRGFTRFSAAMLTLERIGVQQVKMYAAAARRARSLEEIVNPSESVPLLAQFQGALSIVERLAITGAVGRDQLERVTSSLIDVELTDHRYHGRVAKWLNDVVLPLLSTSGRSGSAEDHLAAALAERNGSVESFVWEGDTYTLDDAAATRDLSAVRKKQGGNTLDALLAAYAPALTIAGALPTVDQIKTLTNELNAAARTLTPPRAWPEAPHDVPDGKKIVDRVVRELGRITKPQDASKAAREVAPMIDLLDYLLGETLVALAYAPVSGGAATFTAATTDVSHRHTFGVAERAVPNTDVRRAWLRAAPGSTAVAGAAVTGSLFGIDLTFATKKLRRIASDSLPAPPKLNPNDGDTLITTVALLNPRRLTSSNLGAIGAALTRGRERVRAAARNPAAWDALAARAGMSSLRRQLLPWAAEHMPDQVERLFSVSEVFWIGTDADPLDHTTLDAWGMSFEPIDGCHCLRLPRAGSWDSLVGREPTKQFGSGMVDLNLRVAGLLSDAKVPAPLFAGVMSMAMRDYLDTVPAMYFDDWEAISSHAWTLTRERLEDYVSALVASGPVRIGSSSAAQ